MANHYGVRFVESSAKQSKNVETVFNTMTREIQAKVGKSNPRVNPTVKPKTLKDGVKMEKKKGSCC